MRKFASTILTFIIAGVAALLPFVVTVFIAGWAVRLADAYVGPSSSFGTFLLTVVGDRYKYPGYLVGYLVVVLLIIFLGFLVTRATVSSIHKEVDGVLARIPFFGKIYSAVGQAVDLFGGKGQGGLDKFGGVGQVRMGNISVLCLLTSGVPYTLADGKRYFLVFVPNSPIPATGFNMLVPEEDFHRMDMPMEDFVKLVMSLGLLAPQILPKLPFAAECKDVGNQHSAEG